MHTHQDAIAHITEAIEATGVVQDAAAEYDLDGIADKLYTAAGGTWDLDGLDTGIFWWVVHRHARDEKPRDEVSSSLAQAAEKVANARQSLKAAEAARDLLLTCTYHTGTYTITELARMSGLTRARVSQILS